MTITAATVTGYLERRGLLTPGAAAPVQVLEVSSRNRNFVVRRAAGSEGYFVKQLRVPGPESLAMLAREAAVYALAASAPGLAALRPLLPAFHGFDEVLTGARARRPGRRREPRRHAPPARRVPPGAAEAAGRALATLHRDASLSRGPLSAGPPGIYTAHCGGPLLRWLGPGQRLLVDRVRAIPALARSLDGLAAAWRPASLVHGDVKWDNVLARPPEGEAGAAPGGPAWSVYLVDWELADLGDGTWDAGSLIQSYLAHWALSAPARPRTSLADRRREAAIPLEAVAPAARAFWARYSEGLATSPPARRELQGRTLAAAAARLLQTALETMHGRPEPTPVALSLFDLGADLMAAPSEGARLLGLDP